ncbi:MAG: hypothetical protein QOH90_994, partial [Actinomycetota bacterium]|nr:hypothetical protein [Actinomycetota bacterium]
SRVEVLVLDPPTLQQGDAPQMAGARPPQSPGKNDPRPRKHLRTTLLTVVSHRVVDERDRRVRPDLTLSEGDGR